LTPKETISDLGDLVIAVKGVVTPKEDAIGLYGKLKSGSNLIQELKMNDAKGFNMSNYTTYSKLKSLTFEEKGSSSLNTPGSITFGIRTTNQTL